MHLSQFIDEATVRLGPCCANHLTQLITSRYGKLTRNHGVVGTPIAITRSPQRCLMMFAGKSLYCDHVLQHLQQNAQQ